MQWLAVEGLTESLVLDVRPDPDTGSLHVALEVALDIAVDADNGDRVVRASVISVEDLQLAGELAPGATEPTVAQRRETLAGLSFERRTDANGHPRATLDPAIHDALGPGLHSVTDFIGLPRLPARDAEVERGTQDGHTSLRWQERVEQEESVDGSTASIVNTHAFGVVADAQRGVAVQWKLENTATMAFEGEVVGHHLTMTAQYAGGR